jgi:3-oxoacyl-[acyl-carrier protein] reductase
MTTSRELVGKTAIVTGATRGLGRAIALKLANNGANIAFNYLVNKELADQLSKEIKALGVSVLAFHADIKDFKKVQEMKDAILDKFETFDILVNNAGVVRDRSLASMSEDDWDSVIDTNLKGVFNMTKAVIFTFMKKKQGHIINISSVSGLRGMIGQSNYSASKGGIISFTRSLAKEVAPFNIRVNAVAPGFIESDMLMHLNLKKITDQIPLGRLGKPEEVAQVVNFLLTKEASYMTGQVIQIDGGLGI